VANALLRAQPEPPFAHVNLPIATSVRATARHHVSTTAGRPALRHNCNTATAPGFAHCCRCGPRGRPHRNAAAQRHSGRLTDRPISPPLRTYRPPTAPARRWRSSTPSTTRTPSRPRRLPQPVRPDRLYHGQRVLQEGQPDGRPGLLPANDSGWAVEIALDVDMVSAVCPKCHILLVEANSNSFANLGAPKTPRPQALTSSATAGAARRGRLDLRPTSSITAGLPSPPARATAASRARPFPASSPLRDGDRWHHAVQELERPRLGRDGLERDGQRLLVAERGDRGGVELRHGCTGRAMNDVSAVATRAPASRSTPPSAIAAGTSSAAPASPRRSARR